MTHEKWKIVHELSNYTRQPKSLLQQHRRDSWQAPSMGGAPGSGCREELCGLDPRLSELGVRPRGEQEQPQKEDQQLDPACGCRRGEGEGGTAVCRLPPPRRTPQWRLQHAWERSRGISELYLASQKSKHRLLHNTTAITYRSLWLALMVINLVFM